MSDTPSPNPDTATDTHQTAATNEQASTGQVEQPASPQPVEQASTQPASITSEATTTNTAEHTNAISLANEVQPRSNTPNEEGIVNDEDVNYKKEPVEDVSNQVDSSLTDLFTKFQQRTGREVKIFHYNAETKKADIRLEGYNARQTEQVISSEPSITSIGRDDFRDLIRVGTEPSPIRDKYCFGLNGERLAYFD